MQAIGVPAIKHHADHPVLLLDEEDPYLASGMETVASQAEAAQLL